jgi:hypothetical protein
LKIRFDDGPWLRKLETNVFDTDEGFISEPPLKSLSVFMRDSQHGEQCPCCFSDEDHPDCVISNENGITKKQFVKQIEHLMRGDENQKIPKIIKYIDMMIDERIWMLTREVFVVYRKGESANKGSNSE